MSDERRKQIDEWATTFANTIDSIDPKQDLDWHQIRAAYINGCHQADANPLTTPTLSRLTDAERERLRADRKQVMEQGIDLPLFEQRNLIELVERLDGGAK
jgi:hypothetical protein